MTRASISSLAGTPKGLSLLWIHILLLFWITLTWIATLCWISLGAFKLRQAYIYATAERLSSNWTDKEASALLPHPHPPYTFTDIPVPDEGYPNIGLRSRTVMVSNIPHAMRKEEALKDYFTHYMSQKLGKPSMGLTSSTQPGLLDKCCAFLFNRLKNWPAPKHITLSRGTVPPGERRKDDSDSNKVPIIERIIISRAMWELASLIERREEALSQLEAAHIKLANKALFSVKAAMDRAPADRVVASPPVAIEEARQHQKPAEDANCNYPETSEEDLNHLIAVLGPFVQEFGLQRSSAWMGFSKLFIPPIRWLWANCQDKENISDSSHLQIPSQGNTIWEALLSLPRESLNAYQPRVKLRSYRFHEESVSEIDYFTAKLDVLSSHIAIQRERGLDDYDPVSTAFVTFTGHAEARKACKYLAAHPNNPLACLVTMAPAYEDIDWTSIMKPSFNTEDWVVNIGVWAFTLFWLFPVSLLVGLVSIQNISRFWPSLKAYLDKHAWQEEIIQSFVPTILVAILAFLIPVILFLIAKKAHTIKTLSALHDLILMRYYKFLVVNVLVFFCIGTAALQSFLLSFKSPTHLNLLQIVADSFPSAGPFYVGWLIFSTAIHGFFELALGGDSTSCLQIVLTSLTLVGLPLLAYPSTAREITPRKRAIAIRPRTFTYYYWIPNHLLVLHVLFLFSVLNPFVLPFGALYFFVQMGVIKNQFIHVYARNYEGNGQIILIRVVRYSLDGLILAQAVFLAYMVVLKKPANVGLSVVLLVVTALAKIILTRICRAQFDAQDVEEAKLLDELRSGKQNELDGDVDAIANDSNVEENSLRRDTHATRTLYGRRRPSWIEFSSKSLRNWLRLERKQDHIPADSSNGDFSRLRPTMPLADDTDQASVLQQLEHIRTDSRINSHGFAEDFGDCLQQGRPAIAHPRLSPWDDQTMVDRPYDNPFYARTIGNVLWLPRNPCGALNLDDTVDLRTPLIENITTNKMRNWFGVQKSSGANSRNEQRQHDTEYLHQPADDYSPYVQLNGPSLFEAVLQTSRPGGADIEQTTANHSNVSRPTPQIQSQRRSAPGHLSQRGRSLSEGGGARTLRLSRVVPFNVRQMFRTRSSDIELGVRSSTRSGAEVGFAANTLHPRNISAHEAIFHEVIAEEHQAFMNRLEEERFEEDKAKAVAKSWLTSWMFQNAEEE